MIRSNRQTIVYGLILLTGCAVAFVGGYLFRPTPQRSGLLPEMKLHADAATQNGAFAMAVGPMDDDVEGVCILDFLTGELTVTVMDTRNAKFNALFKANVIKDLGIDQTKRPQYLMATGRVDFPRGVNVARPGHSLVYVLDTTSGTYAAYGMPWRRELASAGRTQAGNLTLLDLGKARTAAIRQ